MSNLGTPMFVGAFGPGKPQGQRSEFNCAGIILLGSLLLASCCGPAYGASKKTSPGPGFQARIEAPEADVAKAVQQVVEDEIIHGTYSYEKERTLTGAHPASGSSVLGEGEAGTKVFYKVAENVLAPRYFKETGDIGTVTVRYLLRPLSANATLLQIDAVFVDARRSIHRSQGAVESAEFGVIQQHMRELQAIREQGEFASSRIAEQRQERAAGAALETAPLRALAQPSLSATMKAPAATSTPSVSSTEQDLEQRVRELRHQVERRVKGSGTPLKSAPFRSATTLQKLPAQAEVVVLILTPYWLGVETEDGHRGWIHRDQLETLP
jgi:hypothetical protein